MRILVEIHSLIKGDKFVVIGGSGDDKVISGRRVNSGTVFIADAINDDWNIPYNIDYNVSISGDTISPRIRLPYKNELKPKD